MKNIIFMSGNTKEESQNYNDKDSIIIKFPENYTHPYIQVEKGEKILRDFNDSNKSSLVVFTNSSYIVESINKLNKKLNKYNINCKLNNNEILLEELFESFSKPFEDLVFDQ